MSAPQVQTDAVFGTVDRFVRLEFVRTAQVVKFVCRTTIWIVLTETFTGLITAVLPAAKKVSAAHPPGPVPQLAAAAMFIRIILLMGVRRPDALLLLLPL